MRWAALFVVAIAAIFWLAIRGEGGTSTYRVPPQPNASATVDSNPAPEVGTFWTLAAFSKMPKEYYQGITSDRDGRFYFDGIWSGLYRTDSNLRETARNEHFIPPDVRRREGYNHLGDLSWDAGEGGRLLLPVECFSSGTGRNTKACKTTSIAVGDPETLEWRYYVKLDPTETQRAAWNEVSPDGDLLWTSTGEDLLAFRTRDIRRANAAPAGRSIAPARRLVAAVPTRGITGATFHNGLLLVAGVSKRSSEMLQIWSIDTNDGSSRLEVERRIIGESEGLDVASALDGILHWQILPYTSLGRRPTYGRGRATLLHLMLVGACANVENGSSRSDVISGTATGDKLEGFAGDDVLAGRAGDDCLFGGRGRDRLLGGPGDDALVGDAGRDRLVGGPGDDTITAADGMKDIVSCGPGRDSVRGDRADTVAGCEKRLP